jgi:hypothetical protein
MIGALVVAALAGGGLLYYRHVEAQRAVASIPSHLPTLPTTNAGAPVTASSGGATSGASTTSNSGNAVTASANTTPTTLSSQQVLQSKNPFTPLVSTSSGAGK